MALSRRAGVFSLELWVAVIVVLILIGLFVRSFNSTYDDVERMKPHKLAAVMEAALRQVHASWLAGNQPTVLSLEALVSLQMSDKGYPVGLAAEAMAEPAAGCTDVLERLVGDALPKQSDGWPQLVTTAGKGSCHYSYLFEAGHSFELRYDTATGKVTVLEPAG
ncbi:hypothetical protein [Allohahella marinimesophila]|uniref:Uncharacterized protein n=1 Tax=Allohahella marinimesophila TaxID=1054972 RepID=A0ABP7NWQ4_9GAMM